MKSFSAQTTTIITRKDRMPDRNGCIICGCSTTEVRFAVGDSGLARCRSCGLEFLSPPPSQATLDAVYHDYYAAWDLTNAFADVSAMKRRTFEGFLDRLSHSANSGKLLDVGCATGEMLAVASDRGFDVYGVEISPQGKELCAERFGSERVLGKPLERDDFPAGFFSVVTLCDVIEHIPDPVDFIATIGHILEPTGLLMIITPDTASWSHAVLGRRWPHYKTEHLHYFNTTNLARLCADHFTVVAVERARKHLTIDYAARVMEAYSTSLWPRTFARLSRRLPRRWRTKAWQLSIGEMLMILRKRSGTNRC